MDREKINKLEEEIFAITKENIELEAEYRNGGYEDEN